MRFLAAILISALCVLVGADAASAQQIPPPSGPVSVCFSQPQPPADSYLVIFDGAAPEAVTVAAPVSGCPTGSTGSFALPAARFSVGTHTIVLRAVNAFGSTDSDPLTVQVGIKPGKPIVSGVVVAEG